jgi:hypothetical protein
MKGVREIFHGWWVILNEQGDMRGRPAGGSGDRRRILTEAFNYEALEDLIDMLSN